MQPFDCINDQSRLWLSCFIVSWLTHLDTACVLSLSNLNEILWSLVVQWILIFVIWILIPVAQFHLFIIPFRPVDFIQPLFTKYLFPLIQPQPCLSFQAMGIQLHFRCVLPMLFCKSSRKYDEFIMNCVREQEDFIWKVPRYCKTEGTRHAEN